MTVKEAIFYLKTDRELKIDAMSSPEVAKKTCTVIAYDIGIEALEKQIPKKPEYYGNGYSEGKLVYDYAKCPVCGRDDFEYDINNWGCNYCPDCGQALEWNEEE